MLTIESTTFVPGTDGRKITDFLLDCDDERYRRWWPGTHLHLHPLARGGPDHVGDVVLMDERVGRRHLRMTGVVVQAVPGRLLVWQLKRGVRLPVRLTLALDDRDGGTAVRHTIRAGFGGIGRVLDWLLRLYFSPRFVAAMDDHVRTEFPMLADRLGAGSPWPAGWRGHGSRGRGPAPSGDSHPWRVCAAGAGWSHDATRLYTTCPCGRYDGRGGVCRG